MKHFLYLTKERVGVLLILLSSFAFGIKPAFMIWAFDAGVDVYSLLFFASVGTAFVSFCILKVKKLSFHIPKGFTVPIILMGVFEALVYLGYSGSINYIPVSIAEVLFFTFPLMVAFLSIFLGEELARKNFIALIIAFVGLTLVLNLFSETFTLNILGCSLALVGAFFNAIVILFSGHFLMKKMQPIILVFYGACVMTIIFGLLTIPNGMMISHSLNTWWLIILCIISSAVGTLAYFGAIFRIGAIKTSLLSNLEPVIAILFALALLGETLLPLQGFGVLLVLSAVVMICFNKKNTTS